MGTGLLVASSVGGICCLGDVSHAGMGGAKGVGTSLHKGEEF